MINKTTNAINKKKMMNYTQALDFLHTLNISVIKLRLAQTEHLLHLLKDPHLKFRSIHVGGTNGKGSVCAMIYSALKDAGYSVGAYTSPHLMEFTERINVNGEDIPEEVLAEKVEKIIPFIGEMKADRSIGEPTFFEVVTAIAFQYFADKKVEYAVVEVGLGGRLDSTNVVKPLVSVITNIQLDHTEILGKTLPEIAREKAGIIKEGVPVVTAELSDEALLVIEEVCSKKDAFLYVVGRDITYERKSYDLSCQVLDVHGIREHENLKIPFSGEHQLKNATTAITALDVLDSVGVEISEGNIRRGFSSARWPGRFEVLSKNPTIILDCAHNPAGAETLGKTLKGLYGERKATFVLGVGGYKDISGILAELAPYAREIMTAKSSHPQAASPETICNHSVEHKVACRPLESVEEAVEYAKKTAKKDDIIVFSGSIYFVGEVRKILTE